MLTRSKYSHLFFLLLSSTSVALASSYRWLVLKASNKY